MRERTVFRYFSTASACAVIAVTATVFYGWANSLPAVVKIMAWAPAMVPWTALSLFIIAYAQLVWIWRVRLPRMVLYSAQIFIVILALVQFIFIADSIFNLQLGLERLMFASRFSMVSPDSDFGKPAPQTSLCLFSLSACLMSIWGRRSRSADTEILAWIPIALCFLAVVGYLFRSIPFFGISRFTGMALHTALCIALLASSALAIIRGPRFMMLMFARSQERRIARNFLIAAFLLPVSFSFLLRTGEILGLYDAVFSHALFVVIMTICFGGFIRFAFEKMRENIKLESRKKGAEAANAAKSQFLAHMSHEIRTPLGAILGFSELMQSPAQSNEERLLCLSTILKNGYQLSRVIDDILDLSKIELHRLEIEKLSFSVRGLVVDLFTLLDLRAREKGLSLSYIIAEEVPDRVESDPGRIRQILLNIVGNAIKFTAEGEVTLHVDCDRDESGQHMLVFTITDSGIGMSPEQMKRIFRPFVQGDSSINRRFGGTGLGLSLSRRLAQLLGGDLVLLSSSLGRGSEFRLTLAAPASEMAELPSQNHLG